jgi:hypothetical protein
MIPYSETSPITRKRGEDSIIGWRRCENSKTIIPVSQYRASGTTTNKSLLARAKSEHGNVKIRGFRARFAIAFVANKR